MRKAVSLSMGVALAATVFAAVPASAGPATVVEGGDCAMPGFGSGGELVMGGVGTVKKIVRNENHAIMTCKGSDIINDYGRTHDLSGFACYVMIPGEDWILTADSRVIVSKSGEATLKCKATFVDEAAE